MTAPVPPDAYDRYYAQYAALFPLRLAWRALWTRSRIGKISLLNRQRDYRDLEGGGRLLALHRSLNALLAEAAARWGSYDYGEGYFYQSFRRAGIRGLRDTEGRVAAMQLPQLVRGKRVLEIGCNTGFLSLSLAGDAARVSGFDINPFLIEIARAVAAHLEVSNVDFFVSSFEDLHAERPFDVVLSFANHSTYDGNTKQSVQEYFHRCRDLTEPGGLLLFESHPPEHEGPGLERVCALIGELFEIQERRVPSYGTFLDRGRTFIVARRAESAGGTNAAGRRAGGVDA